MDEIKTFSELKVLDVTGLCTYAREVGEVELDSTLSQEQLLSKCASIFLAKKNGKASSEELANKEMEEGEDPELVKPLAEKPVKTKPRTKKQVKEDEAKMQAKIKAQQEATGGKQDYERCSICSIAITHSGGKCSTTGKPLCKECLTKINKTKEGQMNTKAKATKEGKAAKKTTSTKTGKKAVAGKAPAAIDKYGFRKGTKLSAIFAALIKGATRAELDKIGGPAVPGALAGIVKEPADWSAGRSVKWDEGKYEKDIYKIESWKPKA